jgi:methionine-R-sulfoxide reductase
MDGSTTMITIAIGAVALGIGLLTYRPVGTETGPKNPWGFQQESPKRDDKLVLSDSEWKARLTPAQYKILRNDGTEPAFCGRFFDNHKTGAYFCAGCGQELFRSDAKFDSGTGWPSFFQPANKDAVWLHSDASFGMVRWEVRCSKCDGHLGHVFEDGPAPTGLRFCMNSDAMTFKEDDSKKKG